MNLVEIARLIPGYDPWRDAGDCVFDEKRAAAPLEFIAGYMTHVKGELAGRPIRLEPWQQAPLVNIFGWYRPDGTRRYRKVFYFVPRKNGKTTWVACVANYMLYCDGEPGAENYCAAADRDQASLVYGIAASMLHAQPELARHAKFYIVSKSVEVGTAVFRAISAESKTKHGYNCHLVIIDELHAQRDRTLVDVLETGTGARRQPLTIYITTSDFEREGSVCNETHAYATAVRDGTTGEPDPYFLPVIYEASIDADWTDPDVWAKANPNLGISLKREYVEAECRKAQEVPAYENTFKRLHLNIRTEQATRWLVMEDWDACAGAIDMEALKGRPCYAGLDLSKIADLSALVLVFDDDPGYTVLPFFWCPEEAAELRERRDRGVPYLTWARQGFIEMTPGNAIDYRVIRKRINELALLYRIIDIGYDPYNASHLVQELQDEDGLVMVEFRQGAKSMSAPSKELERALRAGELRHGGNPILRWNASNVSVRVDSNENIMPDKKSSAEKIDGLVATIMGIGRTMAGEQDGASVYEERGLVTL